MSEYCNDCQNYLIEIERLTKENEKLKEENKYQKRGIEMLTRETEADDKELEHLHAEIEALRSNLRRAIEIAEELDWCPPAKDGCDCEDCEMRRELQKLKGE